MGAFSVEQSQENSGTLVKKGKEGGGGGGGGGGQKGGKSERKYSLRETDKRLKRQLSAREPPTIGLCGGNTTPAVLPSLSVFSLTITCTSTWYAEHRGFESCLRQLFFFS